MLQPHFLGNRFFRFSCLMIALVCHGLISAQDHDFSKNSTRKDRVVPGPLASKIGQGIQWRENLASAQQEAEQTGKPVFWYVPTVAGTFMDRKDSVDRYMLAGPFSWPVIIDLVNQFFIPVKGAPRAPQQREFDLKPYVFIEPGFLILSPTGELVKKVDRLTTFHPQWFEKMLSGHVDDSERISSRPAFLQSMWDQFAKGEYEGMDFSKEANSEHRVEKLLLQGMVAFRLGDHDGAKELWQAASQVDPESPLAWKAAAEAEGFGPFVRGFEVYRNLPPQALTAGQLSPGSAAPQGTYQESDIWHRGIDFLLGMQNRAGCWTDSDYDFGGTDSLPNVHAAVTSIAAMALFKAKEFLKQAGNDDQELESRIDDAIRRAVEFIIDNRNLNLYDRDELFWAYAYRIRLLSLLLPSQPDLREPLERAVKSLEAIQGRSGAWFHEYPNPFVTATAILAFAEAAEVGVQADPEIVSYGLSALRKDRFGNGGFLYSSQRGNQPLPEGNDSHIAASIGRMPICELALWLHGNSDDQKLAFAIERSFSLSEPFLAALKYDDHTSNMGYGGFFIWFDIEKRGAAIERVGDPDLRNQFKRQQRELILSLPEIDGCFVDSHELGRVYGTAMALLSLSR